MLKTFFYIIEMAFRLFFNMPKKIPGTALVPYGVKVKRPLLTKGNVETILTWAIAPITFAVLSFFFPII